MCGNNAQYVMSTQHVVFQLTQKPQKASSPCAFLFHCPGPSNIRQDAPQPQSFMEIPGYPQAAGENTSTSEYFSCVTSSSDLSQHEKYGGEYIKAGSELGQEMQLSFSAQSLLISLSHQKQERDSGQTD